ncbi:5-oxoprolinase subunit C family protein [Aureimonas frigidaquae]|uniref:Putative allophanate hydrolase subunit 2 n=1 Tax=Aureimonas frigidaquae TaxID=424757 RepID=A0A0P0Z3U0_9HYPH|nr:biotin-dependent carboxyltransferase family protein [Aureimonas frigidaquae]BAT28696.1 putative allophanate hydrolase subunit 2 [Aureimonas frigidaquae]
MSTATLLIEAAGPFTSLQDGGRPGLARFGVPRSGPVDRQAAAIANAAAGNGDMATTLEISRGGLRILCLDGTLAFAVAGGGFTVELLGGHMPSWCRGTLKAGERLTVLGNPWWGNWTYLALGGDTACTSWLGSTATHAPSGLGGGRLLPGMELRVEQAGRDDPLPVSTVPCPVDARPLARVRAVRGPQDGCFTADALATFFGSAFRTTATFDRMGMRLAGPSLALATDLALPSAPILAGSVQVAGDGVPTVLSADHQTTGGYPRIATVIGPDLMRLAQLSPNRPVRFVEVAPDEAVAAARMAARRQADYLSRLRADGR